MAARLPNPGGDDGVWGEILNGFLAMAHNPDGTLLSSAVSAALPSSIPTTTLGSGAPSSATFLRGDGTWAVPNVSGGITSVTAADGTVAIGGTASAPTVGVNAIPEAKVTNLTIDLAATEKGANKGVAGGYAPLDGAALVPIANLPTGTSGSTVAIGDDTRITGALQINTVAFSGTNATSSGALTAGSTQGFDTTTGAITATLPTAPADYTIITVGMLVQGGTNVVTINTGPGDALNKVGGSTTLTLSTLNQKMLLVYRSSPKLWFAYDFLSLGALDSRYLTTSAASAIYLTPFAGWQPNTVYTAGYPIFYDAGDGNGLVLRISKNAFTSTSTFSGSNWYTVGTAIATNTNAALIQPTGTTLAAGSSGAFADASHVHTVPTESSSANIKSPGLASVGTSTNFPRADHVHPLGVWQASDSGLITWTYDGSVATSNSALTNGVIIFVKVKVPIATMITNAIFYVQTAGSGLTSGESGVALFDSTGATQLAVSGDISGSGTAGLASTGEKIVPFSSPYSAAAGIYTLALWSNFTTAAPQLARTGTNAPSNSGLTGSSARYGTAQTVTSTPASLSSMTAAQIAWWFALS